HILAALKFKVVAASPFSEQRRLNQWIAVHTANQFVGDKLLTAAERFSELDEVVFAWPNFVSEYRRAAVPTLAKRWHLDMMKVTNGGTRPSRIGKGSPTVVVAVLDDGVDLDHPSLASRKLAIPGKDYTFEEGEPGFDDPTPKMVGPDSDELDFHGTA